MPLQVPELRVVPLTPAHWPEFADLMSAGGPCSRCWCMYWRLGPAYRRNPPASNQAAFRSLVEKGPSPGLLAFLGEKCVGWCQLTPRDDLPWLNHVRKLTRIDDEPVHSISCFYVRKGYRKSGISQQMLRAVIETAGRWKIRTLEAYPLDGSLTRTSSFTGYLSTFLQAGFTIAARHVPMQPIVRYKA